MSVEVLVYPGRRRIHSLIPRSLHPHSTLTPRLPHAHVVNKNKARAEQIKGILESRKQAKDAKDEASMDPVRSKLNSLREKFKDLVKQKQVLRSQFDAAVRTRDAARDATKELKSMIKFKDVEDIESEVQRLEGEIAHSSLSLSEEKKVMESIRQLKNSKSIVTEYAAKMASLAADETTCKEINSAIKSLDTEINAVKKEEDGVRGELDAQRKKEEASGTDNKSLWEEKEKCREACKEAYEKIKDLRAKHDAQWAEFKAAEKVWRAQQAEEKAKKREQYLKEKKEREEERKAREKEMAPEPFSEEIVKCDQVMAYLGKFVVAAEDSCAKEANDKKEAGSLDGMTAFVKKEDPDFAWMKGSAKGGKKGKKNTKAGGKDKESEKLVHTVDILGAFAALKVSVPITKGDCEGVMKEVEVKKASLLKKQEIAKEAGDAMVHENDVFEDGKDEESSPSVKGSSSSSKANGDAEKSGEDKKKGKGKGKGSNKEVALKLDDESSWPSMGGAPVANGASKAAALAPVEVAEEDEMEEGEVLPTPKDANASSNGITVSIEVDSKNGKCSLTLSP